MTKDQIRIQLNSLKRNGVININGYDIRRTGIQWHVTKGDHFRRTYAYSQIDALINKIYVDEALLAAEPTRSRRKNKDARQNERKAQKLIKNDEFRRVRKPIRRNKIGIEIVNVIAQVLFAVVWFAKFFPIGKLNLDFLGANAKYAVIGLAVVTFAIHLLYFRQLGRKHKIINIVWGFISLLGATVALLYFAYAITGINQYRDMQGLAILLYDSTSAITLLGYLLAKLVSSFVLIRTKK